MYQKRNKELEIISLYLGNYHKKLYLREISKLSKIPLKTTQNVLLKLENERILKSKIDGKNKYFSLNLENIKTKYYLLQSEINRTETFLENYPNFKLFIKSLNTNTPIIVFGSFAKFKADKNSDVDLLIILDKKINLPLHLLSSKIHRINLSEKSLLKAVEKQEPLIKEIEENHIILNNHSFYISLMWNCYGK